MEVLQDFSFHEEPRTDKAFVEYSIRSDILEPNMVTSDIGVEPTRGWAKGEFYESKLLDPQTGSIATVQRQRLWGIWAVDSELMQTSRIEEQARYILELLEPKQHQIQTMLNEPEHYIIRFYIRWQPIDGHGSYEILSETLHRMSQLCHFVEYSFLA